MAVKNAVYQVDNGSGFDEIHFKTKAAQVFCENGNNAEDELKDLKGKIEIGSWSPIVESATNGTKVPANTGGSYYIKTGDTVKVFFYVNVPPRWDVSLAEHAIVISNLPFLINLSFNRIGYINRYAGIETNAEFRGLTVFDNGMSNRNLFWIGTLRNSGVTSTKFKELGPSFTLQGCFEYHI